MPQNHLTLTRQSLYDLVWSKPMSSLAHDFGISDVALAKRCRQVDVPIPYRGYWARKAAGQNPPKLALPKYRSKAPRPTVRSGPEPEFRFARELTLGCDCGAFLDKTVSVSGRGVSAIWGTVCFLGFLSNFGSISIREVSLC